MPCRVPRGCLAPGTGRLAGAEERIRGGADNWSLADASPPRHGSRVGTRPRPRQLFRLRNNSWPAFLFFRTLGRRFRGGRASLPIIMRGQSVALHGHIHLSLGLCACISINLSISNKKKKKNRKQTKTILKPILKTNEKGKQPTAYRYVCRGATQQKEIMLYK